MTHVRSMVAGIAVVVALLAADSVGALQAGRRAPEIGIKDLPDQVISLVF